MVTGFGRATQSTIYRDGASGRRPIVPTSWDALVAAARTAMSPEAFAYVAGSSGREETDDANRRAFDRWQIVPRVLRDVEDRDLCITLFGKRYPSPIIAAPIGVLELAHKEADLGIARAASALGIPFIMSSQASVPMKQTAEVMGDSPAGSSSTGAVRMSSSRASSHGQSGGARRHSSSRSTPTHSAGGRATSTSASSRSSTGRASRSTRATRSSSDSYGSEWMPPSPTRPPARSPGSPGQPSALSPT